MWKQVPGRKITCPMTHLWQREEWGFASKSKIHVLSSVLGSLFIDSFTMFFLPWFPNSLNSPACDQQSKCLFQNNYILLRDLDHYSKLYWRNIYSLLDFNRFPFIIIRDNLFFNWGHSRAKFPLRSWCGSEDLRDVQMWSQTPSRSPCLTHW